jgi:hypothetical protein
LPTDDEPGAGFDFSFQLKFARLPDPAVDFFLDLQEEGLELLEILALLAAGDFLSRALLGAGANMPEFGDVGPAAPPSSASSSSSSIVSDAAEGPISAPVNSP